MSSEGEVFVADYTNNRIQVFDVCGKFIRSWRTQETGQGQFTNPYAVCVADGNKYVLVSDGTHRIQVFGLDGTFISTWGSTGQADGQFNRVYGIARSNARVFIADYFNHRVQKFD